MNIFDLLKKDHRKISEIFDRLEETALRKRYLRHLRDEMDLHSDIEESIFYPRLRQFNETERNIEQAVDDHQLMKTLLIELETIPTNSDDWMAKLSDLRDCVEHHVEEEEEMIFEGARDVLDRRELEDMAHRAEEMKEERFVAK